MASPVVWAQDQAGAGATQGGLEEIIVTAQKREESLVEVPASVAAVTPEQLAASGLISTKDLAQAVPGMRVDFSGGYMQPTIRGIGSAIAGTGFSTNVASYVDGFYNPSQFTTDSLFLNVQNIQVLKGPQGTLFGRNATGGAVLVSLRDPSMDPTLEMKASYGTYGKTELGAYGSTGIGDSVAVDLSGIYQGSDGFTDNITTGEKGVDGYDNWAVRGSVLWNMTDNASFKLAYQHSENDDGRPYAVNVIKNPANGNPAAIAATLGAPVPTKRGKISSDAKTNFESQSDGVYLTGKFDLGFGKLTSYTGYRQDDVKNYLDLDSSPLPLQQGVFMNDNKTFTQEFNFNSEVGSLEYVLGAYYINAKEKQDPFKILIGQIDPTTAYDFYTAESNVDAWALFADGTYKLSDQWALIGGLRYSDESSEAEYNLQFVGQLFAPGAIPGSGKPFDHSWTNTTGRFGIRYSPSDSSSVYLTYSQGFKVGLLTPNSFTTTPLDPEKVDAYELGYKMSGERARFEAAAFYMDYQNLQVANYINGSAVYENAANAEIYGAELNLTALVTDGLQATVGLAYTNATYKDYKNASGWHLTDSGLSENVTIPDASGLQMQRAPEWTGNAELMYTRPLAGGTMKLSGTYYYTSEFPFDNTEQFMQDAYSLLNLRAAWEAPSGKWEVAAFGTNVLDEEYNAQVLPGIPAVQRAYGEPAVFGVSLSLKY